MTTEEAIYWALVELAGLGYVERTGPDDWRVTPTGHRAAGRFLEETVPLAYRILIILHVKYGDEGLDNGQQ